MEARAQGKVAARGDALGIPQDVAKLRAKEPILNCLPHEMALIIAPVGLDSRVAHVCSEQNSLCDQLSRNASEGTFVHPSLTAAKMRKAKRVSFTMDAS